MTARLTHESAIRLTADGKLTQNELAWIGFIRDISAGTDPGPTLRSVQALRFAMQQGDAA